MGQNNQYYSAMYRIGYHKGKAGNLLRGNFKGLLFITLMVLFPAFLLSGSGTGQGPGGDQKPNVLLIIIDDMNDWPGAFGGNPQAITPNLDAFAEKGTVFLNAYCAAPLCNPSRTAMLTGYMPSTTGVYGNTEHFREMKGFANTVTLPQYFSNHGYITRAAGKVFHNPRGTAPEPKPMSDPGSFQEEHKGRLGAAYPEDENRFTHGLDLKQPGIHQHFSRSFDWYGVNQPLEETHDWKSADYCARFLKEEHDGPFFIACGIYRPHLPWYAPAEFFDLYNTDDIILPDILESDLDDVGPMAGRMSQKVLHKEIVDKGKWKEAVRAYLANLSFADACAGHLLSSLENSTYRENTIVVIMGDHGWNLGEKLHWSKNVLWEESAKTPLIIYDPRNGQKGTGRAGAGKTANTDPKAADAGTCTRIVSLMDIYPTLIDLCSLPVREDLDGVSFSKLVKRPGAEWARPALTTKAEGIHSLRDKYFRYIRYSDGFEELYDHRSDSMEWSNLASDPSYSSTIRAFRKELENRLEK